MTRRFVTWGGPALLALCAAGSSAQQGNDRQFMTGAEPVSPEDYAKLPKQGRFRRFC